MRKLGDNVVAWVLLKIRIFSEFPGIAHFLHTLVDDDCMFNVNCTPDAYGSAMAAFTVHDFIPVTV